MELAWTQPEPPVARIGRGERFDLHLASSGSARRGALERFIGQRFALQHGARIRHFMPCLFGLENPAGPLFVERDLDQRIETAIVARLPLATSCRGEVVELHRGNIALSDSPLGGLQVSGRLPKRRIHSV